MVNDSLHWKVCERNEAEGLVPLLLLGGTYAWSTIYLTAILKQRDPKLSPKRGYELGLDGVDTLGTSQDPRPTHCFGAESKGRQTRPLLCMR